jgi:hypothetical protein
LLDLDKSSATGLVDRAERGGLIRRLEVREDRRAFRVLRTAEGRQLGEAFVAEVGRQLTALTDCLTDTNAQRPSLLVRRIVFEDAADRGVYLLAGTGSTSGAAAPRRPSRTSGARWSSGPDGGQHASHLTVAQWPGNP